jgi:hypothetical protein
MANSIARGALDVKGKTVLELGAGTALPGLLCAREGAELVSVVDGGAQDVQLNTGTFRSCFPIMMTPSWSRTYKPTSSALFRRQSFSDVSTPLDTAGENLQRP